MTAVKGFFGLIWKLYVGIIFVFFAILLYPFFYILLAVPLWKRSSFRLFVCWSWCMRLFCFYRIRKILDAELPEGPYVIVSNHSSYLDIFVMHSLMSKHPFLFLGKGEILSYPIIRTYFKGLNIPVHRKDRAKAARSFGLAKKAVQEGWSLVIFPEGTIPDDGNPAMLPFKAGAFKLAKELAVPIVPITFTNNFQLFSDPERLFGPARPGVSRVYIHPFLSAEKVNELSEKELLNTCFDTINGPLIKEFPELIRNVQR